MGLSSRNGDVKYLHVLAVNIGCRMMELRGESLQCIRRTQLSQRCDPI